MRAIFLKEFSRLWIFFAFLLLILAVFFGYFSFELNYKFRAIHPESVIWHGYVFFDNNPEFMAFIAVALGFVSVALVQFFTQKTRIKCLLHLPVSSFKILIFHYLFAMIFFVLIWAIFGIWLWILASKFYPIVIVKQIFINWCYFCLSSVLFYLFVSVILVDKNAFRAGILAVMFIILSAVIALYTQSFLLLVSMLLVAVLLGFNALLSHKQTSINKAILLALYAGILAIILIRGYQIYEQKIADKTQRYYIFYSPSLKEFVFQENLGGHYFAYRSVSGKVFDSEKAYKNELAFNYYMDLKQQGKLPVKIGEEVFSEADITRSRASMSYNPSDALPPKIPLYPLFNPDPKVSAIPFGEDMLYVGEDEFVVFHHDGEEKDLSKTINEKAKILGVKFPIKGVFGRFTNLKPFDAGLFFKDSNGEFFNIKIYDDKLSFEAVKPFKDFEYLHINESKNSDFIGLGFKQGAVFLFDKNHQIKRLETDKFDPTKMRLRMSFDPKYLQIRFDDGATYRAYVFDKNGFKKLDETMIKAR